MMSLYTNLATKKQFHDHSFGHVYVCMYMNIITTQAHHSNHIATITIYHSLEANHMPLKSNWRMIE